MILAAIMLSYMIIWMKKQSNNIKSEFQSQIEEILLTDKQRTGIFTLIFLSISREGAELVLLLYSKYIDHI